jgi:hypothetical protein
VARKRALTDAQVQQMRDLEAQGWTKVALAERFAVSETTIANYLRERPEVVPMPPVQPAARAAVDEFIRGLGPLQGERLALAAVAGVLADRVDGARAAGSAAVAAKTLADLVERLAAGVRAEQSEAQARKALAAIGLAG